MQTYNATLKRGDTFNGIQIELLVNGTASNLTGASIKCQFRPNSKIGAVVKTIQIGSGITITNATAGQFRIDPFVADLDTGKYFYDVQITFSSGVVKTYLEGIFDVTQDVTQ
jgi:hypothetical protein